MYRDLVKNLKKNYEIKDKILLKMDNLMNFPPIFCQTAEFLPGGGYSHSCKIFTSGGSCNC